jgi:dihydropteroate synthase-like protein
MKRVNHAWGIMGDHIHFVTGRLAEQALRSTVARLAGSLGFHYSIDVLPITVAALMTPRWVARHMRVPEDTSRIILPGHCAGDLADLLAVTRAPVERGPKDLRQLPDYFGLSDPALADYGTYDIQILAEINHAPQLTREEVLAMADRLRRCGADVIDVGCEPGGGWAGVADSVKALRDAGHHVSIDSFEPAEIELAVRAGAELVLSVNASNRDAAVDWGCEVVAIPDDFTSLDGLDTTVEFLARRGVRVRLDPVLQPIGCGFAASLDRYFQVRRRFPDAEMLMGIGNLTELTDVDSAGINVLLMGLCQELGIRSVLTTEVIHWARTSVRECDLARRLVQFAVQHRRPPKHVEPKLVTLRDSQVYEFTPDQLDALARQIRDPSYRVFVAQDRLHLVGAALHLDDRDPFALFEQLLATNPRHVDTSHAFYLGYELAKAMTALTLAKQYEQDEALTWGYLTVAEKHHRLQHGGARPS